MTDEDQLERAMSRAARAQSLIDSEILQEAFKALEDGYTLAWRSTSIDQVPAREKLFLAINIVGKVKDHLTAVINNGKLAAAEVRQINETAERKKRFGIV